jgi:hypothetical protein
MIDFIISVIGAFSVIVIIEVLIDLWGVIPWRLK